MTGADTTGAASRKTNRGRTLHIVQTADGYACDIYQDGVIRDSARPRDLTGVMTVIARERWTRIDLMATADRPPGRNEIVSLIQAR